MAITELRAQAEQMLRGTGERVTPARVIVLALLLDARRALTHGEVETRIERLFDIDRVTVYRVLDWLTQQNLAHRLAGDDRVWRFTAELEPHSSGHPHFKCTTCGDVICLEDAPQLPAFHLPSGYRSDEVELTIKGLCAECAPRGAGSASKKVRASNRAVRR